MCVKHTFLRRDLLGRAVGLKSLHHVHGSLRLHVGAHLSLPGALAQEEGGDRHDDEGRRYGEAAQGQSFPCGLGHRFKML